MGMVTLRVDESPKAERQMAVGGLSPRRATKVVLAARYAVGIRTIENWQYAGILRASFEQGFAVFNVADCDERLLRYHR